MKINRHNYETLFLMYADNELQPSEKLTVEEFVSANPDLKPELDALLEVTLNAPLVEFPMKHLLHREEIDEVTQEKILLLADGELMAAVDTFQAEIKLNPSYQREWEVTQAARLDPKEQILFPDKSLLYRQEHTRVISGSFRWRAIAACIVSLLLLSVYLMISHDQSEDGQPIVVADKISPSNGTPSVAPAEAALNMKSDVAKNDSSQLAATSITSTVSSVIPEDHFTGSADMSSIQASGAKLSAGSALQNINRTKSNNSESNAVEHTVPSAAIKIISLPEKTAIAKIETAKPDLADTDITATDNSFSSYASAEPVIINEDQIFMIPEEKISRTKLKGFLKKVRRTITRTANVESDGAIRIAGYEISRK